MAEDEAFVEVGLDPRTVGSHGKLSSNLLLFLKGPISC